MISTFFPSTSKDPSDGSFITQPSSFILSVTPYTTVRTRGMKVVAVDEAQKNTSMESQPPLWSEDHIVVSTYPKVK